MLAILLHNLKSNYKLKFIYPFHEHDFRYNYLLKSYPVRKIYPHGNQDCYSPDYRALGVRFFINLCNKKEESVSLQSIAPINKNAPCYKEHFVSNLSS